MFTKLLEWLSKTWDVLWGIVQTGWDWAKSGWFWVIGVVLGFIAITDKVTMFIWQQLQTISSMIVGFSTSNGNLSSNGNVDALIVANTFFPVAELFTLLSALSLVMLAGLVYRFIKSWIPTVN